jgi:uncharacterized protein
MDNKKTALITGATSGIGAAFAQKLAAKGYDLILTGRREELLKNLSNDIKNKYGINVEYLIIELSDIAQIKELEEKIKRTDNLEFLINNAGFGTTEHFLKSNIEEQVNMITVHDIATVRLTHTAIPVMLKNKKGFIINLSSVAAWMISPESSLYCSTKLFLNSFTESLHLSLKNTGIKVQALCPGFTTTDFHKKIGIDTTKLFLKKFMTADYVAEYSLKDLEKNKVISIPGLKYKFVKIVNFIPRKLLYRIVLSVSGKQK